MDSSTTMSSSSSTTLLDEFQAFVTRVKQLHMSRSADADCEQNLSHDKARRRFENATADEAAKPPPTIAKSLDDQQLVRRTPGDFDSSSVDDIEMETLDEDEEEGGTAEAVATEKVDGDLERREKDKRRKAKVKGHSETTTATGMKKNIQVMVGIDEDLKMILEMDPEIVDLGGVEKVTAEPKVMGLPPLTGG